MKAFFTCNITEGVTLALENMHPKYDELVSMSLKI
jgi:hypothetical protein